MRDCSGQKTLDFEALPKRNEWNRGDARWAVVNDCTAELESAIRAQAA
jgi:hypothetical protein